MTSGPTGFPKASKPDTGSVVLLHERDHGVPRFSPRIMVAMSLEQQWRGLLTGPADEVAPLLLGATLATRDGVVVTLVEVEAYGAAGGDPASHAFRGPTPRAAPMFGPPGHLYVYLSYGMHLCVNIVAHQPGTAAGVLLRAARVDRGEDIARMRRGWNGPAHALAAGPGRLGRTLGVTLTDSGADMFAPCAVVRFTEAPDPLPAAAIASGPRVGITKATAVPWRFWIAGEPAVSRRGG